jgi:hypothetical protein
LISNDRDESPTNWHVYRVTVVFDDGVFLPFGAKDLELVLLDASNLAGDEDQA